MIDNITYDHPFIWNYKFHKYIVTIESILLKSKIRIIPFIDLTFKKVSIVDDIEIDFRRDDLDDLSEIDNLSIFKRIFGEEE